MQVGGWVNRSLYVPTVQQKHQRRSSASCCRFECDEQNVSFTQLNCACRHLKRLCLSKLRITTPSKCKLEVFLSSGGWDAGPEVKWRAEMGHNKTSHSAASPQERAVPFMGWRWAVITQGGCGFHPKQTDRNKNTRYRGFICCENTMMKSTYKS